MNKRQVIASLNKIANELDNKGLYNEAHTLTKIMSKIAQMSDTPTDLEEPTAETTEKVDNPVEMSKVPVELLGDTVSKLNGYQKPIRDFVASHGGYKLPDHMSAYMDVYQELGTIKNNFLARFSRMSGFIETQVENVMPSTYNKQKSNWEVKNNPNKMFIWKWRASYIQFVSDEKQKYAKFAPKNQAIREYIKSLDEVIRLSNSWDKRNFNIDPNKKY